MLTRFAAAVAACLIAGPAAAQFACLVGDKPDDTLAMWLDRTGQVPLIEMQMSTGGGASIPMILALDKEGAFSLLMLSPTGSVCIMAVGEGAQPATGAGFPKPVGPGKGT